MVAPLIGGLVTGAWTLLQPFMPIIATKAAEEAGKQIPATVGRLWASIRGRAEAKPTAKESIEELLKDPTNPDLQAVFRVQLKKLIEEDKGFQDELAKSLRQAEAESSQHIELHGSGAIAMGPGSTAIGERGVLIEGDSMGNTVNTGNQVPDKPKQHE
jgi:hypothetical protein